jgi:nitrogen fixation/metabolism regulation signal transduction histidine kinase
MAEKTAPRHKRHPIRNFIIMPDLQWPYIIRLLAIVNLSGVLMATSICALFYFRYHAGPLGGLEAGGDMVNAGMMDVLVEENLMDVIVPAFVIADLVSLAIGLFLSLYFSRKISVPIYRISKWAEVVSSGDLSFRLKFRPGDDLVPLEEACNRVSDTYVRVIEDLRRQITEANLPLPASLESVKTQPKRARVEPSGA